MNSMSRKITVPNGNPSRTVVAIASCASIFPCAVFTNDDEQCPSLLVATGTRAMERLGGLIHRMPQTAFATLIGVAAISALPPLNGFASEWLLFQTILLSPSFSEWIGAVWNRRRLSRC